MGWKSELDSRPVLAMGIPTFMHAPLVSPTRKDLQAAKATVAVLGAPMEMAPSVGIPGAALGPRAIRLGSESLISYNAEFDIEVGDYFNLVDCGDVSPAISQISESHKKIQAAVSEILAAGAIPVVLGGDHSIPHAVTRALDAHVKGKLGIIHFDSHLDTWDVISGFRDGNWSPILRSADLSHFKPTSFAQIGIRSDLNDRTAVEKARGLGIKTFYRNEVFERGIEAVVKDAIEVARNGTDGVYLTFDIDVLDASHAPATSVPGIGGLSVAEAIYAVREVGKAGVICFDVDEVGNTAADPNNITGRAAATIIFNVLTGLALKRAGR
jgi:agmatinase